jgi:hypothetical protein
MNKTNLLTATAFDLAGWFLGQGSSKSQAPSSKKFQAPNLNALPYAATTSLGPWFGA